MENQITPHVTLRHATLADVPAVLELMDVATLWLAKQGREGQWGDGSAPHASNPKRIAQAEAMVESGAVWVAIGPVPPPAALPSSEEPSSTAPLEPTATSGEPQVIGALGVHDKPLGPHIPPAKEPERYVQLLLTHRAWKGRGLGALLVNEAKAMANEAGVNLLRVDCYAGNDGKLIKWYESQGFVKTESFVEQGWPGQLLEMRL